MNVYQTSPSPIECAHALDDARLNAQIVMLARILSAVVYYTDKDKWDSKMHKPLPKRQPIIQWASIPVNFCWLYGFLCAALFEWECRMGKAHKSNSQIDIFCHIAIDMARKINTACIENSAVKAEPFIWHDGAKSRKKAWDFTGTKDVHASYKHYLIAKWLFGKIAPKWTNTNPPDWFLESLQVL